METSNVLNITSNNPYKISMARLLFVFYVTILSNFTDNLFAKQMRDYVSQNRYAQHVLAFMTLFVLITLLDETIDTRLALFYSLFGYLWFIISTKLDIHWNIILLILLFIVYIYENDIKQYVLEIYNDTNLTPEQKKQLIDNKENIQTWIVGCLIIITFLGTFFYSQKKQEQYGGGFDFFSYLFN